MNDKNVSVEQLIGSSALQVCEDLGWQLHVITFADNKPGIELEKYSPGGEDYSFCVEADNFVQNVRETAWEYDADEHAELWVDSRGKNGVPASIRELLDDADAIGNMLQELADKLGEIPEEEEEDDEDED